MRHFLGSRALREIQKSMRKRGSKCATFVQNHIWTHCAAPFFSNFKKNNNFIFQIQLKWSSYRKVPMLVVETTDGRHIQVGDSVLIVSALASLMRDQSQGGSNF